MGEERQRLSNVVRQSAACALMAVRTKSQIQETIRKSRCIKKSSCHCCIRRRGGPGQAQSPPGNRVGESVGCGAQCEAADDVMPPRVGLRSEYHIGQEDCAMPGRLFWAGVLLVTLLAGSCMEWGARTRRQRLPWRKRQQDRTWSAALAGPER